MLTQKRSPVWTILLGCATAALLLDLPFRALDFLKLVPVAGPKNMLPVLLGLMFGPAGAVGNMLGVLASGCVRGALGLACLTESVMAGLAALLVWFGWYSFGQTEPPCMKQPAAVVRFVCVTLLAGAINGAGCGLLASSALGSTFGRIYVEVQLSTLAWSLLLGLPVLIMMTSMFADIPVLPRRLVQLYQQTHAAPFDQTISNNVENVGLISDAIDEFNMTYSIPFKRGYSLMSCVEELNLKIMEQLSDDGEIRITIEPGDSIVIRLFYGGKRFDPMAVRAVRGDPAANLDIVGILLVREMAVRTGFCYRDGINEVKIIL